MAWIYRAQNGDLMFSKTKPEKVYRFKFRNDQFHSDDARNPFEDDWLNFSPIGRNCLVIWAQSYQEAIDFLEKEWPDAICLDHDLGEEKDGYDIAKYIVNRCIDDGRKLPLFASQSANPVGRENILGLLKNYQKQELS